VIGRPLVDEFFNQLQAWSIETLGLGRVTWPNLGLYVSGCRQNVHNDAENGRFGYAYSLTRNERRSNGGETIVFKEGDAFRDLRDQAAAGHSFFDSVEPRFNRLVVFDDRMPHAVERVEGSMDPCEGRFVLHGHISETEPIAGGALSRDALVAPVDAGLRAFAERSALGGLHGPLSLRLDIAPNGAVGACRVLLDRVISADASDARWSALLGALVREMQSVSFPAADAPSFIILPMRFGAKPANI
jgi:hypothetical protein